MCGIAGTFNVPEEFSLTIFDMLWMLQHRGTDGAGAIASNGSSFFPHCSLGPVAQCEQTWPYSDLKSIPLGVGHTRYRTTGASVSQGDIQPFVVPTPYGPLCIAHNGDTPSYEEAKRTLAQKGITFNSTSDTEVIAHHIATQECDTLCEAILEALSEAKSSFALIMATPTALIGCRDPYGLKPLSLAKLGDGYVLASETCAFDPIRATYIRDIEPGEMIWIDESGIKSYKFGDNVQRQQCAFELVYFSRPDSFVFGRYVDKTRHELGIQLAKEYGAPQHENMVFGGVPDSAIFAAQGYAQEIGGTLSSILMRHHHAIRSFTKNGQEVRTDEVKRKFNPVKRLVQGKWCVLIDDSLVRGTTMRRIVRMLKQNEATGVTVLIASPLIFHPCRYGIDMKTYQELAAAQHKGDVDAICRFIEADELRYLSLEGFEKVLGNANDFCMACFNGNYPF